MTANLLRLYTAQTWISLITVWKKSDQKSSKKPLTKHVKASLVELTTTSWNIPQKYGLKKLYFFAQTLRSEKSGKLWM